MQFLEAGPDIPDELIEAHEDGIVVFFCGAGISMPAGLPSFGMLVEQVWDDLGVPREGAMLRMFENKQYDKLLDILERHPEKGTGQEMRGAVRRRLEISEPLNLNPHESLIRLADLDKGGRLITTNFDDLFRIAYRSVFARSSVLFVDSAPRLPIPRLYSWASLVHLHGWLEDPRDPTGRDLILTTADFGSAYLVDGWASRFATEVFRNFVVVFVGYSLSDPPMRYLMDALAAARGRGDAFQEPYAFVGHKEEDPAPRLEDWRINGIRGIPYRSAENHRHLWESLAAWADLHRGGLASRRYIALKESDSPPESANGLLARRVCWALREKGGRDGIARRFANKAPAPDAGWLSVLDAAGLLALPLIEGRPETAIPLVSTVHPGRNTPHPVTAQLGRWLARVLHDHRVLDWAIHKGGVLHPNLRWAVRQRLDRTSKKQTDSGIGGFAAEPPIPEGLARIWRVLASDEYAVRLSRYHDHDHVPHTACREDNPLALRELLAALVPLPLFRRRLGALDIGLSAASSEPDSARLGSCTTFAKVEMALVGGDLCESLGKAIIESPHQRAILPRIAHDLTTLLHETMDLFAALNLATADEDQSYWHQPSIGQHDQNRSFHAWTVLIDLLREAFLALEDHDTAAAEALVRRWSNIEYPLFHRLILFAATESSND